LKRGGFWREIILEENETLNTIAKSPTLNPYTITKSAISGEHIDSLNVLTFFHFVAEDLYNKKMKLLLHGPQ